MSKQNQFKFLKCGKQFISQIQMRSSSKKYVHNYIRPLCFYSYCEDPDCTYCQNQLSFDHEKQKDQKEKKLLTKIKDTAQMHETIKRLKQKFPNLEDRIKSNSILYLEEQHLNNKLHLLKMHLNKDGHIDYEAGVHCNINCGDFYFRAAMSSRLQFGKKHYAKTWKQVEKIDPQYIDWVYKQFDRNNIKQNIAEYIKRKRKHKEIVELQVRKALSEKTPSFDGRHSGKTWEQIEKEDPKYIDWIYQCFGKDNILEEKIADFIIKRRVKSRQTINCKRTKDKKVEAVLGKEIIRINKNFKIEYFKELYLIQYLNFLTSLLQYVLIII